jgi:hypothetical protein
MIHEYHHDRKTFQLYFCWQQNIINDLHKKLPTNEPASNISGLNLLIHTDRFFKSGGQKKKIRFASKKGSYVNNEYVNGNATNRIPTKFS